MTDVLHEDALYIGGEWVPGGDGSLEVEDPATEELTGVVTRGSAADVDAAVDAAGAAFAGWASTPVPRRVELLQRLHGVIADRADLFAGLIQREQGSPLPLARRLHVDVPLAVIDNAAQALAEFEFESTSGHSLILREPVGVVAAITPWNLPLHQVVVKVVPALAAGCTVVLKPAELTPLTAFELARAVEAAGFPAGVFNVVSGAGDDVGARLVRSAGVDHVSFTGSTEVGRRVAAAAAETIKRSTLELGGKSASVVLRSVSDALLLQALKVTVANCYLNGGQTCTALSRLIVPSDRLDQVEEMAAEAAAKYAPGDRLGPLISAAHRKRVEGYLTPDAARHAVMVAGPATAPPVPERGHYVAPTVYSRVDPDAPIAQDEIFGPVLSILAADSDDQALELANRSIYGLGGAVWADDAGEALEFARSIRSGQVDVNGAPFNPRAPFGGYKQSGIGREIGDFGISDVLEVKAVQR